MNARAIATGAAAVMGLTGLLAAQAVPPEEIEREVRTALGRDIARAWYPRCVDASGGFQETFDRQWTPKPDKGKFVIAQARSTWTAAQLSLRDLPEREKYRDAARHGFQFLRDCLWDEKFGGFYWGVEPDGRAGDTYGSTKGAYAQAFGLYAVAATYLATKDGDALRLARRSFEWTERHVRDARHGGYHEVLTREGHPVVPPPRIDPAFMKTLPTNFVPGHQSSNSQIHLLEAYTQLYRAWPDPAVRTALASLLATVRDRWVVEPGCLLPWMTMDWKPIPEPGSPGHDVETAFLLTDAACALGIGDHARTWQVARSLVDHALDWGWDGTHGGFYNYARTFNKPLDTTKVWWVQAEGLNALSLLDERFGHETDRYRTALARQWQFIRNHLIDPDHGGWIESTTAEGTPVSTAKGHNWKAQYHDGRALMLVVDRMAKVRR